MNTIKEQEFNIQLGRRLARLRQSHRMSQESLGIRLGVSYQAIQKHESGKTRMPPERIAACARIFDIPVEYFFGTDDDDRKAGYNKMILTIAAEILALPNDDVRKAVYHMVRAFSKYCEEVEEEKQPNKIQA